MAFESFLVQVPAALSIKKTQELTKQPNLYSKDTSFMQEVQVLGEHISHIHTDNTQGVENVTIKHEDVLTPTQTSLDMYQSQEYEDNVSHNFSK